MINLNNIKISTKLLMSFSIILLIVVAVGIAGFNSTRKINDNLVDISTSDLPSVDYLVQADRDLYQLLTSERSMIFAALRKFQSGLGACLKQALVGRDSWPWHPYQDLLCPGIYQLPADIIRKMSHNQNFG